MLSFLLLLLENKTGKRKAALVGKGLPRESTLVKSKSDHLEPLLKTFQYLLMKYTVLPNDCYVLLMICVLLTS